eukprot:jgi/Hompol1/3547/HPOL_003279-RA
MSNPFAFPPPSPLFTPRTGDLLPTYSSVCEEDDSTTAVIGLVPFPPCIDLLTGPATLVSKLHACITQHWPLGIKQQTQPAANGQPTVPHSFVLSASRPWREADTEIALTFRLLILSIVKSLVGSGWDLVGFLNVTKNMHRDSIFFERQRSLYILDAPVSLRLSSLALTEAAMPLPAPAPRLSATDNSQPRISSSSVSHRNNANIVALSLSDTKKIYLIGTTDAHTHTAIDAIRESIHGLHATVDGGHGSVTPTDESLDDIHQFNLSPDTHTNHLSSLSSHLLHHHPNSHHHHHHHHNHNHHGKQGHGHLTLHHRSSSLPSWFPSFGKGLAASVAAKVLEQHHLIANALQAMAQRGFRHIGCGDLATINFVLHSNSTSMTNAASSHSQAPDLSAVMIQEIGTDDWFFQSVGNASETPRSYLPAYWPTSTQHTISQADSNTPTSSTAPMSTLIALSPANIVSLWIHKPSSICIIQDDIPSIHETLETVLTELWTVPCKYPHTTAIKHKSTGIIEFNLHGDPFRWLRITHPVPGSNGIPPHTALMQRTLLLGIFTTLAERGWRLVEVAATRRVRGDNMGIFFDRGIKNCQVVFVGLALDANLVRLMTYQSTDPLTNSDSVSSNSNTGTLFAIDGIDTVDQGTSSRSAHQHAIAELTKLSRALEKVFEKLDMGRRGAWESPTCIVWRDVSNEMWVPTSTRTSAVLHRLIARLIEAAKREGFELCCGVDLTSRDAECDMIVFRKTVEGTRLDASHGRDERAGGTPGSPLRMRASTSLLQRRVESKSSYQPT